MRIAQILEDEIKTEEENWYKFEDTEEAEETIDNPYIVSFTLDYDEGIDPLAVHPTDESEVEERAFAKELFEELFGVELSQPEEYILEDNSYIFKIPKTEIKEVMNKISQYTDMEGQDFIPLTDHLVAFNFSIIDPLGIDEHFPRENTFEDEIQFSEWSQKL